MLSIAWLCGCASQSRWLCYPVQVDDNFDALVCSGRQPNAWFRVLDSSDVAPGEVKEAEVAGQQFAVFRGADDHKVHVLDAYCPHLGAHFAHGGSVVGNTLKCPFHNWQFNGATHSQTIRGVCTKLQNCQSGMKIIIGATVRLCCVVLLNLMSCPMSTWICDDQPGSTRKGDGSINHIPYCENAPEFQKAHSWPCVEYYGMVRYSTKQSSSLVYVEVDSICQCATGLEFSRMLYSNCFFLFPRLSTRKTQYRARDLSSLC